MIERNRPKSTYAPRTLQIPALSALEWRSFRRRLAPPQKKRSEEDIRSRMHRVEAVLFLAREPLVSRKISDLADLEDGTEARTLIRRLNRTYDQTGRAYRIESIAGGFQLLTRPAFVNWLRKLRHIPGELRLSPPAFETLAVVAYRQPVIRADIEAIRGVACGEILRQLMDQDLVRISGRREELGRPFLYSTTKHFLKSFGLNNLDALPRAERIRQATDANEISASDDDSDEAPFESTVTPLEETSEADS